MQELPENRLRNRIQMGTMSKLLNKPFRSFSIYALIILICSIPAYYVVVDGIWMEELDEHNDVIRERMERGMQQSTLGENDLKQTLKIWNDLQPGTELVPISAKKVGRDSVYTTALYNNFEHEMDRFRVRISYISIQGKPYKLTICTNVEEAEDTLYGIGFVTVCFFVLLVLGFVVLNRRIARKTWKPFYETLNRLNNFDLTKDEHIPFDASRIEEFELLNNELTRLILKNRAAFDQQKRFIENASHELQTPLAILKTKIDVLLQSEQLSQEQSTLINAINANLSRISRINKNLLLLAKIENNQFSEKTSVNLRSIVLEATELLQDYYRNKGIRLDIHVDDYSISCNATLLEVLVNNFITNAIRHGLEGDTIRIVLRENELTVYNSGIHELNGAQLFVRFGISSSETTSSGLGLAISKEICDRYDWKISYTFEEEQHAFTIKF